MRIIDNFLDKITMYRLMLYFLTVLVFFGFFLQPPIHFGLSLLVTLLVSWITNRILSRIFNAPTNLESVYISALILALIVEPSTSIIWLAILTQASKYLLAVKKKHIFNPVAIALIMGSVSWWISNIYTLPVVLVGGLLLVRKLRKGEMVLTFMATTIFLAILNGHSIKGYIISYPLLFFAFVMLTEPLTSPTTRIGKIIYGIIVGLLFSQKGISPEIALIIGNIFAYLVNSKEKLILTLKEKIQIAPNIYEFIFESNKKLNFLPGQYLEWTLAQHKPDSRGSRRYLTIASSPTEPEIRIGVKYYSNSSSFKKTLLDLKTPIVASQLAGDFVLPKDPSLKLAFVAGGIGITPYRSMIKYLIDSKQSRDIVLIYINKTAEEIVYKDILEYVPTIYINTSEVGHLNDKMVNAKISDARDRTWYISGPHSMVTSTEKLLKEMGIKHIKTDFFPGLV